MAKQKATANGVEEGKVCAALSYILVGIIWYFADENMRKNEFAKFHTKQALVLLIVSIVGSIIGTIIPIIGWFIILPLVSLFTFVLWIIGLINAFNGKMKPLPVIGGWASMFTF